MLCAVLYFLRTLVISAHFCFCALLKFLRRFVIFLCTFQTFVILDFRSFAPQGLFINFKYGLSTPVPIHTNFPIYPMFSHFFRFSYFPCLPYTHHVLIHSYNTNTFNVPIHLMLPYTPCSYTSPNVIVLLNYFFLCNVPIIPNIPMSLNLFLIYSDLSWF